LRLSWSLYHTVPFCQLIEGVIL